MRAMLAGKRHFQWDFARGPLPADLLLRVSNLRSVPASVCCQTGTSLSLQVSQESELPADHSPAHSRHRAAHSDRPPGWIQGLRPGGGVSSCKPAHRLLTASLLDRDQTKQPDRIPAVQ